VTWSTVGEAVQTTSVEVPDGRTVEVWAAGPPDGPAMVFHHGTPNCGRPERIILAAALGQGIHLLGVTRPGYGCSTRLAGRDVAAVAADAAAVLDRFDHDRCVTFGISGGGPHALGTAAVLGDRVAAVASIAGMAPYGLPDLDFLAEMGQDNLDEYGAALAGDRQLREYLTRSRTGLLDVTPEQLVAELSTLLAEPDRTLISGERGEDMVLGFRHALAPGIDGWFDDDMAFIRPWGFDLQDIRVPAFVYQGGQDLMVPIAHGRWLTAALPDAHANLLTSEGHLSVYTDRIGKIFGDLAVSLKK
jgi:pimeloyl-ACP methyl ester carboxylesterase